MKDTCQICGHQLHLLKHPLRRLRGSGHWLKGVMSIFTRPLKACADCGTVYTWEEELVAEGAVPTTDELRLANLRSDMKNMRDSFLTVAAAAGFITAWMIGGTGVYETTAPLISALIGAGALVPATYFQTKARGFKREIRELRKHRIQGHLEKGGGTV
jgi:hypothetical protein